MKHDIIKKRDNGGPSWGSFGIAVAVHVLIAVGALFYVVKQYVGKADDKSVYADVFTASGGGGGNPNASRSSHEVAIKPPNASAKPKRIAAAVDNGIAMPSEAHIKALSPKTSNSFSNSLASGAMKPGSFGLGGNGTGGGKGDGHGKGEGSGIGDGIGTGGIGDRVGPVTGSQARTLLAELADTRGAGMLIIVEDMQRRTEPAGAAWTWKYLRNHDAKIKQFISRYPRAQVIHDAFVYDLAINNGTVKQGKLHNGSGYNGWRYKQTKYNTIVAISAFWYGELLTFDKKEIYNAMEVSVNGETVKKVVTDKRTSTRNEGHYLSQMLRKADGTLPKLILLSYGLPPSEIYNSTLKDTGGFSNVLDWLDDDSDIVKKKKPR